MPLQRMKRLLPLLAQDCLADELRDEPAAEAEVSLSDARFSATFGHDRQGAVTIDLRVEAELPLTCQRSLEPYMEPVRRRSLLCVIEDEAEEELLPADYEPVLVSEGKLALLDLVEDELLLAVPQVPKNPAVEAVELSTDGKARSSAPPLDQGQGTEGEGPRQRPFADLAGLMKKKARE